MISLEMARKLKDAGLEWNENDGDFFYDSHSERCFVVGRNWTIPDCDLFAPRLDQLLAEVANRLWKWIISQESCEIWPVGLSRHSNCIVFEADTPDDAAAFALLWILERR